MKAIGTVAYADGYITALEAVRTFVERKVNEEKRGNRDAT